MIFGLLKEMRDADKRKVWALGILRRNSSSLAFWEIMFTGFLFLCFFKKKRTALLMLARYR